MSDANRSNKYLLLAMLLCIALGYGIHYFVAAPTDSEEIEALKATVVGLESNLAEKELQLKSLQSAGNGVQCVARQSSEEVTAVLPSTDHVTNFNRDASRLEAKPGSFSILRDLESVSANDSRSFVDKLKDFLANNANADKNAIASRAILSMARNRERLPDYALQSLYDKQSNDDLKRIIAQVLSQRGNHSLLDNQIAEAQARLKSDEATDRQAALNQLAKTRSARAADAILPYLDDSDTTVRLDALLALRDTGNQKHASMIEPLINDPDIAVSALAHEVLVQLRNLSSTARSTISKSDIESTLPPVSTGCDVSASSARLVPST